MAEPLVSSLMVVEWLLQLPASYRTQGWRKGWLWSCSLLSGKQTFQKPATHFHICMLLPGQLLLWWVFPATGEESSVLCSFIRWAGAAQEETEKLMSKQVYYTHRPGVGGGGGRWRHLSGQMRHEGQGAGRSLCWGFRRKGRAGLGRVSGLEWASLSSSRGFWPTGVAPGRLVPGPGMLRERSIAFWDAQAWRRR